MTMLQERTFCAKEKKSLADVIAIMNMILHGIDNMILHGIDAPSVVRTNTLAENVSDLQEKGRFEVLLANPPFGGKERPEVQNDFPTRTGETTFLFRITNQDVSKSLHRAGTLPTARLT